MIEFVQSLAAVVAFLLPIGAYCLFLAWINRRPRPVMTSGSWDTLGLVFAASGFFGVTIPLLLTEFYKRTSGQVDSVHALWLSFWAIWLGYYLLLVAGSIMAVRWRSHKTLIYNVDLELFPKVLEHALALIGLESRQERGRLVLTPVSAPSGESTAIMEPMTRPPSLSSDRRSAEIEVETFPSMCHVTLHWRRCEDAVRSEIEHELDKTLESAAPLENPAAGWFLSVSGLILGAVAAVAVAIVFVFVFLAR